MKKLILIIAVLLSNCVSQSLNVPEFRSPEEAMHWVHNNIEGVYRSNYYDWRTPEEVLESGNGVCAELSILLMEIFKQQFGYETSMVSVKQSVTYQGTDLHAIVYANGKLYDPTRNQSPIEYQYSVIGVLDYDIAMGLALPHYTDN